MMVWLLKFFAQLLKVYFHDMVPATMQLPNFDFCLSLFYLKELYDLREQFRWFLLAIFFDQTLLCHP